MPVDNEPNKIIYNTNGVLTEFSFPYKYYNSTDLTLIGTNSEGTDTSYLLDTDYTITTDDPAEGCLCTFDTAPVAGTLLIKRELPQSSDANFRPVSGFPEEVITDSFDAAVMRDQDLQEQIDRSPVLGETVAGVDPVLPNPVANMLLGFNATATAFALFANLADIILDVTGLVDGDLIKYNGAGFEKASDNDISVSAGKLIKVNSAGDGYEYSDPTDQRFLSFCMSSGNIDSSGNSDIIDFTGASLKTKTGGSYPNLEVANADRLRATVSTELTLDISSGYADGTYNAFVNSAGSALTAVNNTIYSQIDAPSSPVVGDIWFDFSVSPETAKIYNGATYESFTGTPIGTVTIVSNLITAVTSNGFNQNGYNVNSQTYSEDEDLARTIIGNRVWISSEYTPVRATLTTVNHNLNLPDPKKAKFDILLVCAAADGGYSVGDFALWGNDTGYGDGANASANLTTNAISTMTGATASGNTAGSW